MEGTAIDLRSDSVTMPTEEMYQAMCEAPLGNDLFAEDPTVQRLEEMAAERMGKEAALFVPSGTMGNLIALMVHGRPGEAAIVESRSHILCHEVGGMASIAGLLPIAIEGRRGIFSAEAVGDALSSEGIGVPRVTLACLENTHNHAGGVAITPSSTKAVCQVAKQHGLSTHLDGARIFNAAIALETEVPDLVRDFDSVMMSLSKGLSAPVGSLLIGTTEFIARARTVRKRLGGGMYQVGIVAVAGIVALEKMVDRLAEDHATARLLAEGIAEMSPVKIDLETVQTNIVIFDLGELGEGAQEFNKRLSTCGVLASTRNSSSVRMVTHRHISPKDVLTALEAMKKVLASFGERDV